MGVNGVGLEKVCSDVMQMTKQFRNDAESFYDPEAIEKGYIVAKDRNGNNAVFPLLTVSAVILALPAGRIVCSSEEISNLMAKNKKTAKNSPEKLCIISIGGSDDYSTMPN